MFPPQNRPKISPATAAVRTDLSHWKTQIRKDWPEVKISDVQIGNKDRESILVGESLQITARVHLGAVDPQHVRVEAYHGEMDKTAIFVILRQPCSIKVGARMDLAIIFTRERFLRLKAELMASACASYQRTLPSCKCTSCA